MQLGHLMKAHVSEHAEHLKPSEFRSRMAEGDCARLLLESLDLLKSIFGIYLRENEKFLSKTRFIDFIGDMKLCGESPLLSRTEISRIFVESQNEEFIDEEAEPNKNNGEDEEEDTEKMKGEGPGSGANDHLNEMIFVEFIELYFYSRNIRRKL